MSVSAENVTGVKRIHTTGEGQHFSGAISFSLPFSVRIKENHIIIVADNYQGSPMWRVRAGSRKAESSRAAQAG